MNRRDALQRLFACAVFPGAAMAACRSTKRESMTQEQVVPARNDHGSALPIAFLAHGSPYLLDDAQWVRELATWATKIPRPRAILMISAHWEARPVTIGATTMLPLIYDFYGFPQRYYDVTYPSPGAPALAQRVRDLLRNANIDTTEAPARGLDHGAYVPLICMYPQADVPVLQISLPTMESAPLFALGGALAPLRHEGVLMIGSGFLTHNMRAMGTTTPSWAAEFDHWAEQTLASNDVDALLDYRSRAPGVQIALPTHEHFVPVIVAAGAASESRLTPTFPITGFAHGSFTKRSVQYG